VNPRLLLVCHAILLAAGAHFPKEIFPKLSELGAFDIWVLPDLHSDNLDAKWASLAFLNCMCQNTLKPSDKEKVDRTLCKFLIDTVFNFEDDECDGRIYDTALKALVSASTQFSTPEDNIVLHQLRQHERVYEMGQKFIVMLNRGSGTVSLDAKPDPKAVEGCLYLLQHIFRYSETATTFFYWNDLKVLIDVILRESENLGHGIQNDTLRRMYLDTLELLLLKSEYGTQEVKHRTQDIASMLKLFAHDHNDKALAEQSDHILQTCTEVLKEVN